MATLDREFEFYQDNKERFLSEYQDKFIVIKGEEVIGVFEDQMEAVEETRKKHQLGTFMVKEVVENDTITFRSREIV